MKTILLQVTLVMICSWAKTIPTKETFSKFHIPYNKFHIENEPVSDSEKKLNSFVDLFKDFDVNETNRKSKFRGRRRLTSEANKKVFYRKS